ncbi:MAG: hypothetical protein VKI63_08120 [Cyanobium sp.]|nr:hypothetical protein [Cyanobium sp.]
MDQAQIRQLRDMGRYFPVLPSRFGGALALLVFSGTALPALAAVQGSARALPYPEALDRSRVAAEAVLARAGAESCLRGKLTNALLGLSASCEAQKNGQPDPACALAEKAVVQLSWPLPFMDATARELLQLIGSGAAPVLPPR